MLYWSIRFNMDKARINIWRGIATAFRKAIFPATYHIADGTRTLMEYTLSKENDAIKNATNTAISFANYVKETSGGSDIDWHEINTLARELEKDVESLYTSTEEGS